MAGLKKPVNCKCGSKLLHREYNPERWVCDNCSAIVRSRQKKPDANSCRECDTLRGSKPFKKGKNLCMGCYNELMRKYNHDNRERILQQKKDYYAKNKERIRERSNSYWQGSPETFISDLFRKTKKTAKRRIGAKKDRNLVVEIDRDFLIRMYHDQDGKCALSKLPMEHKWHNLCSISVDRIDSGLGYIRGNVQLVCKWANLAKGSHGNEDFEVLLGKVCRVWSVD